MSDCAQEPFIKKPSSRRLKTSFAAYILRVHFSKKQLVLLGILACTCAVAVIVGVSVGLVQDSATEQSSNVKLAGTSNSHLFESWDDNTEDSEYVSTEPPPSPSELGEFDSAAVSADGQPCAQIAIEILRKNGSAADAAIAGLFCVGVINTQSMGLGGGFLLTYYERSSGKAYTLDARETAPAAAHEDMYHGDGDLMEKGGLAVAVPGELRGYRELYTRFGGRLPWSDLLEPTINLCEEGHLVNWHMARALKFNQIDILNEPSMSVFINPETGDVYKENDTLKRPQLAKTLRILQEDPDGLYTGQLANKLADDIQEFGGIITSEDLQNYKPEWREAMNVSLQNGNMRMFSIMPPGSGLILGFILNILDEYGFTPDSMDEGHRILTHHRITEAMKWAYAKRTELGDSNFVDVTELTKNLTSDAFAKNIRSQITDNQTFQDPEHYGAVTAIKEDHGTAHFSLLAPDGDAVSVTSTINLYFGAGIRSKQTGIVLNDEMDDFSAPNITNYFGLPPSPANFIRPGKRPLSSMCPAVFVDSEGDVRLVIGAAGGTKISSGVAWASLNNLWLGDDIKEAIDARRIHHQLFPMTLSYEDGIVTSQRGECISSVLDVLAGLIQRWVRQDDIGYGGWLWCTPTCPSGGTSPALLAAVATHLSRSAADRCRMIKETAAPLFVTLVEVAKNCFGEDAALEMERIGMEVGKECWMKEWEDNFGMTSGRSGRTKRNILKMPNPASTNLLVCNLRALNVLTPKYEMNYPLVDAWISTNVSDAGVREKLLRLSKECQPLPIPLAPLETVERMEDVESIMKGVRKFHIYMDCMNLGGTDICMNKEMERVKEKWDNMNYP
ncbi:scoloptoxin SSD14-like isoform X6 [Scylla paramamosain]|uniref:scoloptoxin SSD14-like isoform X6 n=1 Tax=Scylla paramamosain TaxID=85552 RepID=UPI0030836250